MHKIWSFVSSFRDPTKRKRFLLFALASAVTTIGGWLIIRLLVFLGWSIDVANIVQAVWSISVAFYLNNRFAWGDRRWIPTIVKVKLYSISKVVTVSLNAIAFRVLLVLAPFSLLLLSSYFGVKAVLGLYSQIDDYAQAVAYIGSTVFIMFVNWMLYDQTVFATRYLKELKHTHLRIYRWVFMKRYF